jgi:hypothetical protein
MINSVSIWEYLIPTKATCLPNSNKYEYVGYCYLCIQDAIMLGCNYLFLFVNKVAPFNYVKSKM